MAIKQLTAEIQKEDRVDLSITNGDKDKLMEVLREWKFKDIQSLIRFSLSALLVTKDCELWIKNADGISEKIKPSEHLLKDNGNADE